MCIFYINESNQALIPYLPPESTFCSRIYFPRHYTKSVKNIVTPSITLFTADQQYLNVAGLFGCLLETQAERYFIVVRAGRASGRERYLVPFFPFCSELPLLFLVLLRICGFFFPPIVLSFCWWEEVEWQSGVGDFPTNVSSGISTI